MRLTLASQGFTTDEIAKKIEELVGKFKIGADTIKEDLVQVVEVGTAKEAKIEGKTIAGKTGTAEIKENQEEKINIFFLIIKFSY